MNAIKRLLLLSILLLVSCAGQKGAEKDAMELATEMTVAYFTFDYENVEDWMLPVQDEFYYETFIHDDVLPVMAPYMQRYFIQSSATLDSVEEYARGQSRDGSQVIIWRITVQVDQSWPKSGPPSPFGANEQDEIPWTWGKTGVAYGTAAYRLGVWNVKLLARNEAEAIKETLTLPDVPQE